MTLIFSNHRFQYEVERLFRNFINEPGIKLSTDKADAQGDFCLTEKVEYPGGAELSVDLVREGKRFCMSRSIPGDMPEKEQERELCILLYKALREYTGRDLPWGILTGQGAVEAHRRAGFSVVACKPPEACCFAAYRAGSEAARRQYT